jgi:hypothetical protein
MGEIRNFKVKGSVGVYDMYKAIRKHHWYNIGRPITEKEFYGIIRGINNLLAEELANGQSVDLPDRMGRLELRKYQVGAFFKNGKLKVTYPVDWYSTNKLWEKDEEARKNKTLLYHTNKWVYFIKYCTKKAAYENKIFYQFAPNTFIKRKLSKNIKQNKVDTLYD